jgi:hypothetical protein
LKNAIDIQWPLKDSQETLGCKIGCKFAAFLGKSLTVG